MFCRIIKAEHVGLVHRHAPSHNVPGWKVTPWMIQVYLTCLRKNVRKPISEHDKSVGRRNIGKAFSPDDVRRVHNAKLPIRHIVNATEHCCWRRQKSIARTIQTWYVRKMHGGDGGNVTRLSMTLRHKNGVLCVRLSGIAAATVTRSFPQKSWNLTISPHMPRTEIIPSTTFCRAVRSAISTKVLATFFAPSSRSYYSMKGPLISPRGVC